MVMKQNRKEILHVLITVEFIRHFKKRGMPAYFKKREGLRQVPHPPHHIPFVKRLSKAIEFRPIVRGYSFSSSGLKNSYVSFGSTI